MNSNLASKVDATFKYYDKDGKRLSIFYVPELKEVVIFKCSKKDIFKKAVSWRALAEYLHGVKSEFKPVRVKVDFSDKYIQDFRDFCDNFFFVKVPEGEIKMILVNGMEYKIEVQKFLKELNSVWE